MWQITGQTRVVSLLQNSLKTGRSSHAYLFTGPEHIGKMTLAIDLARALNCGGPEPPCGECHACRKISSASHPDVQVIGLGKSNNGSEARFISIEQIKNMQHDANLPPFEGNHKVFIIENAELLSVEAANSLLKTLEEPVGRVTFVLLTVNERLLPETVVSRCQRLELLPVPAEEITPVLVSGGVTPGKAALLSRLSHGCPGWALTAARDENLLRQRDERLDRMLELIGGEPEMRFAWAGQLAARFTQNRKAVYAMLETWLDYWRDLMLVKLGCHDMITNVDRRDELASLAGSYRLVQIRNYMQSIAAAAQQLRQNVNARLALEVLMLDTPIPEGGGRDNPEEPVSLKHG